MRDVRTIRVSENSYEAFYRKVRKNHPIKKEYSYIAVDGSHVNDLGIANEFSTIFDSIKNNKKNMIAVIRCKDISTENLSEKLNKYRKLFKESVKEYQMAQGMVEENLVQK